MRNEREHVYDPDDVLLDERIAAFDQWNRDRNREAKVVQTQLVFAVMVAAAGWLIAALLMLALFVR